MKHNITLPLLILFMSSFLFSCESRTSSKQGEAEVGASDADLNKVKSIIQDKTNRFTAAHITKDTAYLNSIFTEDARVYPPGADAVIGKQAISKLNTDWVNYGVHEFRETTTLFYGNNEFVIDEGTYYLRYGNEKTVENGKYINIWKQQNGDWKIYSNIWNSSKP